MSETTFLFPAGPSDDSCDSDENEVLYEVEDEGHVRSDQSSKVKSEQNGRIQHSKPAASEENGPLPDKSQMNGEELQEAIATLREQKGHLLKRRKIVYQLMATSVIVTLHGMSFLPYFFNNSMMNIRTLSEQTATMWAVLVAYCVSCLYTPSFLYRVQMNWTMAYGCVVAAIFSLGRFYPTTLVLVPCGVLLGLSLGPFYSAASRHIARLASTYEGYQGSKYEETVPTFIAIFVACISFSPVWISFLHIVLFEWTGAPIQDPSRFLPPESDCGFNFWWNWVGAIGQRDGLAPEMHDAMAAQLVSCLICTIGGVVLSVFTLGDIPFPKTENVLVSREKVTEEFKQVTKKVQDSNLLLLFPVYMCVGFLEAFCYTIFVQAFVYCEVGANNIYYSTLIIALSSMITCFLLAYVTRHVSRQKLALPEYVAALVLIVVLVIFGESLRAGVLYMFSAMFGVVLAVLTSQIHALTSREFADNLEVSQALQNFGKSLAYLITFILVRYHGDNSTVTGCVMGTCIIAFVCHLILEIRIGLADKSQESGSSGAYVLLEEPKWIPSMDPKTVKADQTKQLSPRRIPDVRNHAK